MSENAKINKEIAVKENEIRKLKKKKKLSPDEQGLINIYQKRVDELKAKKAREMAGDGNTSTGKPNTSNNKNTSNTGNKNTPPSSGTSSDTKNSSNAKTKTSLETVLENSEQKAQEAADAMNSEEDKNKKVGDAASATQIAKEMANTVDANIEENVPTWFWREAREMAPTDKAKRGFIISNYITNRLGTALGNTGAIVQNNGGSGGGQIKEQGGSYIDQYRQGKMEQVLANRKAKQDNLMKLQNDTLVAIGISENETRAIQNKLRNSKHWNKYNRLTNEQQVYIKGLLYGDTEGKVDDAILGELVDRLMEGKDVSIEQLTTSVLTAAGMNNAKQMVNGASNILNKAIQAGEKVGSWASGWLQNYKKAGD